MYVTFWILPLVTIFLSKAGISSTLCWKSRLPRLLAFSSLSAHSPLVPFPSTARPHQTLCFTSSLEVLPRLFSPLTFMFQLELLYWFVHSLLSLHLAPLLCSLTTGFPTSKTNKLFSDTSKPSFPKANTSQINDLSNLSVCASAAQNPYHWLSSPLKALGTPSAFLNWHTT